LYAEIFSNASFPDALLALDRELAGAAKLRGCPRCGAALDVADYPRKPRGGPFALADEHGRRLSLCCRRDGCRQRVTPPSVRFLGRRVYFSAVVLLCGVLRQGPTRFRVDALRRVVGADRRTLELAPLVGRARRAQPCLRARPRGLHAAACRRRAATVLVGLLRRGRE
jgi:hypothetical protein